MRKIIYCGYLLLIAALANAQQTDSMVKNKISFHSYNQGGILIGQSDHSALLQTVNGVSRGKYFAGIGVGLDYYFERTVPVFLDLRRDFFAKENTPFLYADAGYQYPWLSDEYIFETDHKSGLFYEAGIGYKFPVTKSVDFIISGGYSYKQYSKVLNTMPWISIWPAPKEALQRYDYQLRRIAVKLGLVF